MLESKESLLILFTERKKETPNTLFYEKKFNDQYKTKIIYISDYLNINNHNIAKNINEVINKEKISLVLFQGDGLSIMDTKFIRLIDNKVKKGIFSWDDPMYHHTNRITASACDFVLSGCPISVLKFQELGYKAFFLPVESSSSVFKDLKEKKIYDVLFFGRQKNNRSKYLEYLKKNNIKVLECGPYDEISNTFEKLNKLINQSKIILNFTEQDNSKYSYNPLSSFKYQFTLRGRAYFIGLCGALCISEYDPSAELLFKNNELPFFTSENECLSLIRRYLSDESKLAEATKKYNIKCMEFEDKIYMKKTKLFINEISKTKNNLILQLPFWYEFSCFKKNIQIRFRQNQFLSFYSQVYNSLFKDKYENKRLIPIIFILGIISSIMFLIKSPFSKKRYEKI